VSDRLVSYARVHLPGLALLVAVMVGIPVALTLVRPDSYQSRVALYKDGRAGGERSREELRRYIEGLIPAERVARGTALNVRFPLDSDTVVENTRLELRSDEGIDLIATSGTPDRAAGMARLEGSAVEELARRRSNRAGARYPELPRLITRLGDKGIPAAERRRLEARLQVILARLNASAPRLDVRGVGTTEPVTDSLDKLVDRLPGDFPPNPGPFAAALGGLALALGLFAALALLTPPVVTPPRRGG
jgi:hypothetical protein